MEANPNILVKILAWFYPVVYLFVAPLCITFLMMPVRWLGNQSKVELPWVNITLWLVVLMLPVSAALIFKKFRTWISRYILIMIPFWFLTVQPLTGMTTGVLSASISKAFSAVVRPHQGAVPEQSK